jgi:DNA polymerase, archaea type
MGAELSARLARVVPPTRGGLDRTPAPTTAHWLFGCDLTSGIVSVDADRHGRARVWRRTDGWGLEVAEHRFSNWFLTTSLDLLAHLPARNVPATALSSAHGDLAWEGGLTVVHLTGADDAEDAYRYLVLTDQLDEVETAMVETANKADGGDAQTLEDLRGMVLAWQPIEQYLLLSGRTYFKGMRFADLRRLQFDLETTGLNDERDRIFMISLRDSTGWSHCLDTGSMSEATLIQRFVELVSMRDPDVVENHNIFAFDLPFLVRRAARLNIPLRLGRDGSEPELETDVFDGSEPFLRWRIRGREVVDTQHAVRRFGMLAPDLRRHGLKDAARYFGFARMDREYVPGAEIWATYQTDPERVRRYAADDVDEVDGLSRRLLPVAFNLAQLLPRAYERIAADSGPIALWEPLLVRAYLHEGRAIVAPAPRLQRPIDSARSDLRLRGVVGASARATMQPLLPSVVAEGGLHAANDDLAVLPRLLRALLTPESGEPGDAYAALAQGSFAYLAGQSLLSDPHCATRALLRAGRFVEQLLDDLQARGCRIVEAAGEEVLFVTPAGWDGTTEQQVIEGARAYLPSGVRLEFPGHYQALFARAPRNSIMLGYDGTVTLVGASFRPGRLERFGEDFLRRAAPPALTGDVVALRRLFLETVHLLRTLQVPLEELCVQVTLHKSPAQYRRGGTHEEPYEVLLAAGVRAWRVGQRIRYFRAHGGEARLLQEGDDVSPAEADAEYYVQRLLLMYAGQFAQAFSRADFAKIFSLPGGAGQFTDLDARGELGIIKPLLERL